MKVYVINRYGKEVDFEAAMNIMDDGLRNELHMDLAPCGEQEFYNAYCKTHADRFGEEFEPDKINGQW